MDRKSIRWAFAIGLFVSMVAGSTAFAQPAEAAGPTEHPDFVWWPMAKSSNRLYVGNLSWNTTDTSDTAQFNPKEIAVAKTVPWQN